MIDAIDELVGRSKDHRELRKQAPENPIENPDASLEYALHCDKTSPRSENEHTHTLMLSNPELTAPCISVRHWREGSSLTLSICAESSSLTRSIACRNSRTSLRY